MATSSIKKSFVISSKKSALEIATQLLNVENSMPPTLNRPRKSKPVAANQLVSYFSEKEQIPSGDNSVV
ncbi:MAG: hypothetical protein K6G18_15860 [Treponema sp.]|nr:hypothetical protein [Treponema sp.]